MQTISRRKLKAFVSKLGTAQNALEEKQKSKHELHKQFAKVKKVSLSKNVDKTRVEKELEKLNLKVNELLEKEKTLLLVQNSSIKKSDLVKDKINEVYSLVSGLKNTDNVHIPEIALNIKRLESKLDQAVKQDQMLSSELKNRINEIEYNLQALHRKKTDLPKYNDFIDAVDEIKEKVDTVIKEKTRGSDRIKELEDKIKRGEVDTKTEFDLVENKIKKLQNKLLDLKSQGHDPQHLDTLQSRINKLKKKFDKPVDDFEPAQEFSDEDFDLPEPFR